MAADARGEGIGEDLIAAPAALVGGELGEADQLRHQRPHDGAGPRGAALDRRLAAVDALHDLQLALGGDLGFVALPVRLGGDEEGGMARIAEGRLDHEILAQMLGRLAQLGIAVDRGEHIGDRWHARLVADPHGLDLVVEAVAQPGAGKPDLEAELAREAFGRLVEHQEHGLGLAAAPLDVVLHGRMLQQIVVDVLDGLEVGMGQGRRHEGVGVAAVVAIEIADEFEVLHPLVHAEEVEVGGADEIDGDLVAVKVAADIGKPVQLAPAFDGSTRCGIHRSPPILVDVFLSLVFLGYVFLIT